MSAPVIINFGGGTNSTALLIGYVERGLPITGVVFADPGSEMPHTYENVAFMSKWLEDRGYPGIAVVRNQRKDGIKSLEERCEVRRDLPSIAYGFKTCSAVWKRDPCHKWARGLEVYDTWWKDGGRVVKVIGFDADEDGRVARAPVQDRWYDYIYPLVDWDWGRQDCVDAIERAGIPRPGKSSCFFCPSMKVNEILKLKRQHPDLMKRALAMEQRNQERWDEEGRPTSMKGLGRRFAWKDVVEADDRQGLMFPVIEDDDVPCGCYDG